MTLDASIPRIAGRRERRGYLRAYVRQWRQRPENLQRLRAAAALKARLNAPKRRAAKAKWRAANPQAARAHSLVYKAIHKGTLVRPTECQKCGGKCKPHAHHGDYLKPLDVKWWCSACHKIHHAKEKEHAHKRAVE